MDSSEFEAFLKSFYAARIEGEVELGQTLPPCTVLGASLAESTD